MTAPENTQPGPEPVDAPDAAEPPAAQDKDQAPVRPAWAVALAAEVDASLKAADDGIGSDADLWTESETAFLAEVDARFDADRMEFTSRHDAASKRINGIADAGAQAITEFVAQRRAASVQAGTAAAA